MLCEGGLFIKSLNSDMYNTGESVCFINKDETPPLAPTFFPLEFIVSTDFINEHINLGNFIKHNINNLNAICKSDLDLKEYPFPLVLAAEVFYQVDGVVEVKIHKRNETCFTLFVFANMPVYDRYLMEKLICHELDLDLVISAFDLYIEFVFCLFPM